MRRKTVISNKRFRLSIMWGRSRFGFNSRGRIGDTPLGWSAGVGFAVLNYIGKAR
jgi:hypothetical protein